MARSGDDPVRETLLFIFAGVLILAAAAGVLAGAVLFRARPAPVSESAAEVTRTFAWDGGEKLSVGVPGEVRYVPGPDNKVTVTGPQRVVDRMAVRHGAILYLDEVVEALSADGCFTPTSLDAPLDDSATGIGDLVGDRSHDTEALEARLVLEPLLARLDDRDRRIVFLRFHEERSQQETAFLRGECHGWVLSLGSSSAVRDGARGMGKSSVKARARLFTFRLQIAAPAEVRCRA